MSEEITKEVLIDMELNGIRYAGTVTAIYNDIHKVNLGELSNAEGLNSEVTWCGRIISSVYNILKWQAFHEAGFNNVTMCEVSGYYVPTSRIVTLSDGRKCYESLAWYFEDEDIYVLSCDVTERIIRDEYGDRRHFRAPDYYFEENFIFCAECNSYVYPDDWNSEEECCVYCANERNKVIDDYCESHRREVVLFGEHESDESFVGLGFELEVDCESSNSYNNEATAKELCSTVGLAEDEMRYAHDGSLNYGFECISQPHTVKDFWSKQEQWSKMLKYLVSKGYRSHNTNTCGLHVHVSRLMFGKTKEAQDEAIAKVYTFFDENWDDIVKVSRRKNFGYCDKNRLDYYDSNESTKLKQWRKKSKTEGGHYVALNNANRNTFEYRLGRGTLNSWSFFSWIDMIVTITKNARRITVGKVNSNDLVSWLGGIKETTAKYIYKRGAFRETMLALYPSIEWEFSSDDNSSD